MGNPMGSPFFKWVIEF